MRAELELEGLRDSIRRDFGLSIDLREQGLGEFAVITPFQFPDGDHYVIRLQRSPHDGFVLTDLGHTFMHISYDDINLKTPSRSQIIEDIISRSRIENDQGELRLELPPGQIARGLFTFVQAISQLSDIEYLKQPRAKNTFMDDLAVALEAMVPPDVMTNDWTDPVTDPNGIYPVDHRVEGPDKPLFVFGLPTNDKCKDATITVAHFERQAFEFMTLGIFADQTEIGRKVLARFTEVCDRQFPTLAGNERRIERFLSGFLEAA